MTIKMFLDNSKGIWGEFLPNKIFCLGYRLGWFLGILFLNKENFGFVEDK
jgi:hypothetical protein